MKTGTGTISAAIGILSWIFGVVFIVTGILNLFLVHPVPGIFYLLLSFIYFPPVVTLLKERLGFSIPLTVKVILGFVILWGTLAVSDLAEILGL